MRTPRIAALAALAALIGCTSEPEAVPLPGELRADVPRATPAPSEQARADLRSGNVEFSAALFARAAQTDGNVVFSPHSISSAFAMLRAGARGETGSEIDAVFGYPEGDMLYEAANELDRSLAARRRKGVALDVANAAFLQTGYAVAPSYLDVLARSFGAGVGTLDFAQPDAAAAEINGWVAAHTENLIDEIVAPADIAGASLVLTNAVYFKGAWKNDFESRLTQPGTFTRRDGSSVTVPLMHDTRAVPYYDYGDFEAGELAYEGDELSMLVIAPHEAAGIADLEARFGQALLSDIDGSLQANREVIVTIPRFSFEMALDLGSELPVLGLRRVFEAGDADLSGIPASGARELYVSGALHRATIIVNEEGTETAAATAIIGVATSAPASDPPTLDLDRPFLFAIRDRASGTILFLGRVDDPSL